MEKEKSIYNKVENQGFMQNLARNVKEAMPIVATIGVLGAAGSIALGELVQYFNQEDTVIWGYSITAVDPDGDGDYDLMRDLVRFSDLSEKTRTEKLNDVNRDYVRARADSLFSSLPQYVDKELTFASGRGSTTTTHYD